MNKGAATAAPAALSGVNPLFRQLLGERLAHVRGSMSQPVFADRLGVHKNTYGGYERGERVPDAEALAAIAADGWNLTWLLTGIGPELQEEVSGQASGSQDLSEEGLTIALEITDDIVRSEGATYVPRVLYARLLRLMYQGVTQGLPVAEILDFGRGSVRAVLSGSNSGVSDVGQQEMGKAGQGGRR